MVKGVNKNVIEINDTGSEIFDRIVFFVSPKYGNLTAKEIYKETEKFTFNFDARAARGYKTLRDKIKHRRRLALAAALSTAGALLTAVWIIFF